MMMEKSQVEPHPIPIVGVVPKDGKHEHAFISMNTEALDEILLQNDIKDCNCVVLSVAGASRGGKSFLLNFILRYLKFLCTPDHQKTTDNWLGNEDCTLDGFSWSYGSKRNTTGIFMWSEVFRLNLPSDEKIAVIVLDTQGIFDRRSSFRESNTFFTLSIMLSSIQIYNLNRDIPEDALQHLEYFIEYGKLIVDRGHTPFQKLLFLIRDWSWISQYTYGSKGGQDYLEVEVLKISDEQPSELQALRENIKECFSSIGCFLMPHPGLKVVQNENFNGSLSDIGSEFKESIEEFVPVLFPFENLTLKEIGGKKVTVAQWLVYFKWYVELFNKEDLPEPRSMLMATATAEMVLTVKLLKEAYQKDMEIVSENYTPYMTREELEFEHENRKKKALRMFDEKRVMGGEVLSESYRVELEKGIEADYHQIIINNERKTKESNQTAVTAGKETYHVHMMTAFGNSESFPNSKELEKEHIKAKEKSFEEFWKRCKAGGDDALFGMYENMLEQDIQIYHDWFEMQCEVKENAAHAAEVEKRTVVGDVIVGVISGTAFLGTAVGGPLALAFGAVWGGVMGPGLSAVARKSYSIFR